MTLPPTPSRAHFWGHFGQLLEFDTVSINLAEKEAEIDTLFKIEFQNMLNTTHGEKDEQPVHILNEMKQILSQLKNIAAKHPTSTTSRNGKCSRAKMKSCEAGFEQYIIEVDNIRELVKDLKYSFEEPDMVNFLEKEWMTEKVQ